MSATPEGVVVSSSLLGRHRITASDVELVAPGAMLPLRGPRTGDPVDDLQVAVDRQAFACVGSEEVCHVRPQAVVFEAAGMDWDAARDWVVDLVQIGIGQPVEELCLRREAGAWERRAACVRCMRQGIVIEDVMEASGWVPPWERAQEDEVFDGVGGGGTDEPGDGAGDGGGGGPGAMSVEEAVSELGEWQCQDDGAGVGVWPLPFGTGVLSLDSSGHIQCVLREPRPPTPIRDFGERDCVGQCPNAPMPQCPNAQPANIRTFAGWDNQGRELFSAPFPPHVIRPVPLRPCTAPRLHTPPPVHVLSPSRFPPALVTGVVARSGLAEMRDGEVRHIRSLAGRRVEHDGAAERYVRALRSAFTQFTSVASGLLALPLPLRRYWARRGDPHLPPD